MIRFCRFRLRTLLIAVAIAAIGCSWWVGAMKNRELRELRGEWKVVRLEMNGEAYSARTVRRVTWDGDLVELDLFGEKLRYRVSVDRFQNPARMDAINLDPELWALDEDRGRAGMGTYLYGVYSLRRNSLTLCFAEQRPSALFDSTGVGQILLKLERTSRIPRGLNGGRPTRSP
jgi:uncharacterized protein (TIGR03067 family)